MNDTETLVEIRDALLENNRLLRILASPLIAERLRMVLHKDEEWSVYRESDGSPRDVVAERSGVSRGTVSKYWKAWLPLDILDETETSGRYRHRYEVDSIVLEGSHNGGNA